MRENLIEIRLSMYQINDNRATEKFHPAFFKFIEGNVKGSLDQIN